MCMRDKREKREREKKKISIDKKEEKLLSLEIRIF